MTDKEEEVTAGEVAITCAVGFGGCLICVMIFSIVLSFCVRLFYWGLGL